jgi:hypothetical protein
MISLKPPGQNHSAAPGDRFERAGFFEDFERTHGPSLPTAAASFGNEWDFISIDGEVSARVRRAVENCAMPKRWPRWSACIVPIS